VLLFSDEETTQFLLLFAFIPARYDPSMGGEPWPGGLGAQIWTFVTYSVIHADLTHLFFNSVWLLAFGSAVARRFGALRFIAFFIVTAAIGAAVHLATHFAEIFPVVGASAAISGAMAAAMRFAFQRGGPLGLLGSRDQDAYRVPAAPLRENLRDSRVLAFLAVWFGVNLLIGLNVLTMPGIEQSVAWEAHIGGFLAGLFLFAAFDPVGAAPVLEAPPGPDQTEIEPPTQ
jgi:membrane associated rhomboid family serine protease